MGIDKSYRIRVGFVFNEKDLTKPFAEKTEPAYTKYVLDGKETDDPYDLALLVAIKARCEFHMYGNFQSDHFLFVFGPDLPTSEGYQDEGGRITVGGDIELNDVLKKTKQIQRTKKALQDLGLKPGNPQIAHCWTIS